MPKKILVCDDEFSALWLVSYVVLEEGYNLITARDGEDALHLARAAMPDLMLLDIMMPRKDGFEVCRELKSDPATRCIYIILLSAMGQERDQRKGLECGAEEYMTKRVSPSHLRKRLHELLD